MPFGEWMDFWYRTYCKESLAESTQTTYEERIYKQIIPKIGKTPLNQLTAGMLEKFYAHLKADGRLIRREIYGSGLSNAVVRSIHFHCRAALEAVLKEYREKVNSVWLFPSPVKKEDVPRDPSAVRKAFSKILERAQCKHVPFHALRHTFASNAFHYGMDVKMLANAIGHGSVETTMNVYAHATEEMQRAAARKIDEAVGKVLDGDKARGEHPNAKRINCGQRR